MPSEELSNDQLRTILQEINSVDFSDVTNEQLFNWGRTLLSLSFALNVEAIESENIYNQTIVTFIEDRKSVSEATTRAKAEAVYSIKLQYELYVKTAHEAMDFIKMIERLR